MKEFEIGNFEKGLVAERQSHQRKLVQKWHSHYPDITGDEATILENTTRYLNENGVSTDAVGYDDFVMTLVKRVFPKLIAKNIVSVQPMIAPTGKIFYMKPEITTGSTHSDWTEMYEAQRYGENFDASKGVATLTTSALSAITSLQYSGGQVMVLPYSGGEEGLASLEIVSTVDTTGISGANVHITADGSPVQSASDDNDISSLHLAGTFVQFEYTAGTIPTLTSYGMKVNSTSNLLLSGWTVSGSNDGATWDLLGTESGHTFGATEWRSFEIDSPVQVKYIKFLHFDAGASPFIYDMELYSKRNFTLSPQTWTEGLLDNNQISVTSSDVDKAWVEMTEVSAQTTWKEYATLESESNMQQIRMTMVDQDISSATRKLKANYTQEMAIDFSEFGYGSSLADEYAELMSEEISAEIDREIIRDLITIAPYRSEWYYDYESSSASTITGTSWGVGDDRDLTTFMSGKTQGTVAKHTLLTKITQMEGTIRKANLYHGANFIVCSLKAGTVIERMGEHEAVVGGELIGMNRIHETGKLLGRISVFVDPYLPDNVLLMGYNGGSWDCGYIYSPYIMAHQNPVIDPDSLFEHHQGFMTRYGKTIITNKKYGLIDCRFPADFDPVNGEL